MKINHFVFNFFIFLWLSQNVDAATLSLPLWPNSATLAPSSEQYTINKHGAIEHIIAPQLRVYPPKQSNHIAILVISGGGYAREELAKESTPTAQFLQEQGFTVFELIYRLPNQDGNNLLAPFQDGQRALRIIRYHAHQFNIDPDKIGVLGFSAGGHLAGIIATQWQQQFSSLNDPIDQISARPNFVALLYPIISMQAPLDHTHAYKSLFGSKHDLAKQILFSVDLQVKQNTPPTFLAHAIDDPISPVQNSLNMQTALQQHKIAYELHLFKNGGHGWGLGKANTETTQWPTLFLTWLKKIDIL